MNNRSNETVINLDQTTDVLTELIRNQAQTIIKAALEFEVADILAGFEIRGFTWPRRSGPFCKYGESLKATMVR